MVQRLRELGDTALRFTVGHGYSSAPIDARSVERVVVKLLSQFLVAAVVDRHIDDGDSRLGQRLS